MRHAWTEEQNGFIHIRRPSGLIDPVSAHHFHWVVFDLGHTVVAYGDVDDMAAAKQALIDALERLEVEP